MTGMPLQRFNDVMNMLATGCTAAVAKRLEARIVDSHALTHGEVTEA